LQDSVKVSIESSWIAFGSYNSLTS